MFHGLGNNLGRQIGYLTFFYVDLMGETYLPMLRKLSMSIFDAMPLVQTKKYYSRRWCANSLHEHCASFPECHNFKPVGLMPMGCVPFCR
jgi:hypothetical protein